ncbi:acetate/propionate family kinase [Legionella sp. MW5194]|uniref:acetate/propionate family kinase n=1 Tax=Legionella sp. MW5194 TaxID=2662448 RepID=UPI00193CFE5E|nr:acetate/propionate family kinase [Legionella sp. MW5194]QRN03729.1 acetate/propionate family kinase [Legionella sp. MW5194]
MNILTINAGSSSIKYKAYAVDHGNSKVILSGLIEGIGENSSQWHHQFHGKQSSTHRFIDHRQAFAELAEQLRRDLNEHPIHGVGHRVVHGGIDLFEPTVITPAVLQAIENLANLAPIHNPVNAEGILLAQQFYPAATHVALFDSGFHHTMPAYVHQYAIDSELTRKYPIRRYGFHGINHEYVAREMAVHLQKPLSACQFITLHLGNGASACLIKNGQSFDTTMGMTPLPGLMMGTRCGDLDPAIIFYLLDQGYTAREIDNLLNKKSGLKGIAHDNDMRRILARAESGDNEARLAIDMYVYRIQKTIGAYLSQLDTLDALIFTGGIGENAYPIREAVLEPLKPLGFHLDKALNQTTQNHLWPIHSQGHPIYVVRGDEEQLMSQKVAEILTKNA